MSDNPITPQNLSRDLLKEIFESAYMDVSVDQDGDLVIKEACKVIVMPDMERKNRIRLMSIFGFTEESSRSARLECVNSINRSYLLVTTYVTDNGNLVFRYDVAIDGDLPKKNLILTIKRFASIPHDAVQDHGKDIVK
jgi:hypothetical protein